MRFAVFVAFLSVAVLCHAQRTATVSAEYTYYAPDNLTLEQAKQKAVQRAMLEAIAAEFGTLVQQMSTTSVTNADGKSFVGYSSLGSSDVRGEWIRTIGQPEFDMDYRDGQLIINVKIKGEAREIDYMKPQFVTRILRNGTKENYESEEFRDGDYLYMSVISPVSGYAAIFCKDEELAAKMSMIANHGQSAKYRHTVTGCNSRLDTIQAAVLNVKLAHLDEYSAARRKAAAYYTSRLKEFDPGGEFFDTPAEMPGKSTHVWHQYTLKIHNGRRDALKRHLAGTGIPSMIYYPLPLNEQEAFKGIARKGENLVHSKECADSVLSLPMHTELTEGIMDRIVDGVEDFFRKL